MVTMEPKSRTPAKSGLNASEFNLLISHVPLTKGGGTISQSAECNRYKVENQTACSLVLTPHIEPNGIKTKVLMIGSLINKDRVVIIAEAANPEYFGFFAPTFQAMLSSFRVIEPTFSVSP
jgi:hypothetical protein